jgi:hypothetical protein
MLSRHTLCGSSSASTSVTRSLREAVDALRSRPEAELVVTVRVAGLDISQMSQPTRAWGQTQTAADDWVFAYLTKRRPRSANPAAQVWVPIAGRPSSKMVLPIFAIC